MEIPTSIPAKNPKVIAGEIYIKDVSFETVHSPMIFQRARKEWNPTVIPEYHISVNTIVEDWYEVVLCLTVKTILGDDTAYVAEVHQAGIFSFHQMDENEVSTLLGSYCPRFLFPFARETIVSLVQKGGFNQLSLPPIEFDANFSPLRKDADSDD